MFENLSSLNIHEVDLKNGPDKSPGAPDLRTHYTQFDAWKPKIQGFSTIDIQMFLTFSRHDIGLGNGQKSPRAADRILHNLRRGNRIWSLMICFVFS